MELKKADARIQVLAVVLVGIVGMAREPVSDYHGIEFAIAVLAAAQEIEKLKLYCPQGQLTLDTVQQVVADSARFDIFPLSDAMLQGQPQHALRMLQGLRGEGVEAPVVLWAVSRELRSLTDMAQQQARWTRYFPASARRSGTSASRCCAAPCNATRPMPGSAG